MSRPHLSGWQRQVLADLDAIAEAFPGEVEVMGRYRLDGSGSMQLRLRLRTNDIPRVEGGIQLGAHEEVIVTVDSLDLVPPRVEVDLFLSSCRYRRRVRCFRYGCCRQSSKCCIRMWSGRG